MPFFDFSGGIRDGIGDIVTSPITGAIAVARRQILPFMSAVTPSLLDIRPVWDRPNNSPQTKKWPAF